MIKCHRILREPSDSNQKPTCLNSIINTKVKESPIPKDQLELIVRFIANEVQQFSALNPEGQEEYIVREISSYINNQLPISQDLFDWLFKEQQTAIQTKRPKVDSIVRHNARLHRARSLFIKHYKDQLQQFDITGADFSFMTLTSTNLSDLNFSNVSFRKASLAGSKLDGSDVSGSQLSEANLRGAQIQFIQGLPESLPEDYWLAHAYVDGKVVDGTNHIIGPGIKLDRVDLVGLDLKGVNFEQATLNRCQLRLVDLQRTNFANATLSRCIIFKSNLDGAKLSQADLQQVKFQDVQGQPNCLPGGCSLVTNAKGVQYIVGPNLSLRRADLVGADLSHADLVGADLSHADLFQADLSNANMQEVELSNSNLSGASIRNADLSIAWVESTNLQDCDLRGVDFTDAYLQDVHGQPESLPKDYRLVTNTSGIQYIVGPKVNLQGADLRGCNLDSLSLSAAFLEETKLENATLNGSSFSRMTGKPESLPEGYHLIENQHKEPYLLGPQLDLRYADLVGVDFRGMNLSGVNFTGANLMYTKFRGANLAGATFNDAFVKDARFYQSNISGASFSFLKGKPASVPTGYSIRKEASKGSSPYPDFHIVTK